MNEPKNIAFHNPGQFYFSMAFLNLVFLAGVVFSFIVLSIFNNIGPTQDGNGEIRPSKVNARTNHPGGAFYF